MTDKRLLTEEELREIASCRERLLERTDSYSTMALVLMASEDIPRLLAHIEAQAAEIERYKAALEEIVEDISHYEPFDLNLLEHEINRVAKEALGFGEE